MKLAAAVLAALLASSAAFASDIDFAGVWRGQAPDGRTAEWRMDDVGGMNWIVDGQDSPLIYRFDPRASERFDVLGFMEGPLRGRVLYGVIEVIDADEFRVDFEPGPLDDDAARPATLGSDAWVVTRADAGATTH